MAVTQNQRNVAELLVKRMEEKAYLYNVGFEKVVDQLFYYVLKILAKDNKRYEYTERTFRSFTLFVNMQSRIGVRDLASSEAYMFLDISTIVDARKAMNEVANIFNDLPHYRAKFQPYAGEYKRGILTVSINLNEE